MAKPRSKGKMPKYPPKPTGRPPELTPEIQQTIVNSILVGNYFETACAAAGIHKTTAYDWLKWGAAGKAEMYVLFANAVRKAQADAEARDVMVIEMTAHGAPAQYDKEGKKLRDSVDRDWKAAAWRLERKFPTRWGRFDRLEHSEASPDGAKPIEHIQSFTDLVRELEREIDKEE